MPKFLSRSRFKIFVRYELPTLIAMGGIFYLSHKPGSEFPKFEIPYLDKMVHITLYAGLSFLFARLLTAPARGRLSIAAVIGISAVLATLYGATDEWHQMYTPERDAEMADLVADGVGAVMGAFLVIPYRRWTRGLTPSN